ncbi:hypothetical protein MLD38_027067 [Melastoma candidum]|uniref:Uncharacterized protein n=1 Tax=Melastoma candidum TaxID=119954 RepID=A0ACB9P6R3_9MYRT|nr:hypothetical protein MLD38_027067 [Melastoma candidum]
MSVRSGSVKVVIIDTRYVKTDPASFKSVVQKLTGKDSKVPDGEESGMRRDLWFNELDRSMKEEEEEEKGD